MIQKYIFCAHRGMNTVAPENSLVSMAVAAACGADEIEFDLWLSNDNIVYVNHDETIDRTSNSSGKINDLDSCHLETIDNGAYFSKYFKGLKITKFSEILYLLGNKVKMNIHIKSESRSIDRHTNLIRFNYDSQRYEDLYGVKINQTCEFPLVKNKHPYSEYKFDAIIKLIEKYNCENSVYISGEKDVLETSLKLAPEIERCCLEGKFSGTILDHAKHYQCRRVQFTKGGFDLELINLAHESNIICNLFWSDNPLEAKKFFESGIDVILTNDYQRLKSNM